MEATVLKWIRSRILQRNTWPPSSERALWELIEFWSALRRSDEIALKQQASIPWHRKYLISPVPRMVSRASANLLYGEPCEHRAGDEADQDALDYIVSENGLNAEEHRAAMIASSEGEVWGRVLVAPDLADVPIIEFESRRTVIPRFRGRFIVGATFVNEYPEGNSTVYRLFETYEPGIVRATLYMGTRSSIGTEVDLETHSETAGKAPEVYTGFDYPLCCFIPNSIDADPTRGFSDYAGLEERFLAVNESATIGQENVRLAGKKRALVDAKYLSRSGKLPAGDDIFIREAPGRTAGQSDKPLQMVEYDFQAQEIVRWVDSLIDTTLQFAGVAPELVGRRMDGGAISGTALKLRMIHSLMEATGKGSFFDRGVKRLLRAAAVIDSRPTTQGGFGRSWTSPDEDPSVMRGDGLPRDDMEAAQWLVLATNAEAISLEEKIAWLHPDWSEEQQREEIDRIRKATPPAPDPLAIPTERPPLQPILPPGVRAQ